MEPRGTLDVIVGGQYGSESKGRVTADLAVRRRNQGKAVIGVRVAGPNAGHVLIDPRGRRHALRQLPVALAADPLSIGVIAAGSEIDPDVLNAEVRDLEDQGIPIRHRLLIDRQATVLEPKHREQEGGNDGPLQNRIGSTGKGVGAARADRVMRTARLARDLEQDELTGYQFTETQGFLDSALASNAGYAVLVEGTQGYGLGQHAGHYPYCTSSDARAIDFLAMAGLSPWRYAGRAWFGVWVVLRAYPIRVAGNSGPLPGETSWENLNLPQERTTVTNKVRRVGAWDAGLARRAVIANGGGLGGPGSPGVTLAVAMADQVYPEISGVTEWAAVPRDGGVRARVSDWLDRIEADAGAPVGSVGTGPGTTIWLPPAGREVDDVAPGAGTGVSR
jgi:adenylosuccinate synthase